jgi:quercetin dioxygenase-like cupin family protein
MDDTGFDATAVDVDAIPWDQTASDGTRYAVLTGRRDAPGEAFGYAFAIPAGFWDPPHVHSADAHVTVVRGALHLGFGTRLDTAVARVLRAGESIVVPGGAAHFDGSDEDTVIVGTAIGPWWTRYVDEGGTENPDG